MLLTEKEASRLGGAIEELREIYIILEGLFGETETVLRMGRRVASLFVLYRASEIINEKEE